MPIYSVVVRVEYSPESLVNRRIVCYSEIELSNAIRTSVIAICEAFNTVPTVMTASSGNFRFVFLMIHFHRIDMRQVIIAEDGI